VTHNTIARLALLVLALAVAACGPASQVPPPDIRGFSDQANPATPMNEFAVDLYSQLAEGDDNLVFSPLSIYTALTMTHAGARGETATEMLNTLRFGLDGDQLHGSLQALNNQIVSSQNVELTAANALWIQEGYELRDEFVQTNQTYYEAGVQRDDFADPTASASRVNEWVAERTAGRIDTLLTPQDIDPLIRLILTNAVFFKGAWDSPFEPMATGEGAVFHLAGGGTATVAMMRQTGDFDYAEKADVQVLSMGYEGDDVSMVFVLPRSNDGLAELERSLSARGLADWLSALEQRKVDASIPRFSFEQKSRLDRQLAVMGMKRAFEPGRADFSGIVDPKKLPGFYIHFVIHGAEIEVDEQGTVAAAATAVGGGPWGAPPPKTEDPIVFRADHPFLFLIRHESSGAFLFMGRFTGSE